MNVSLPGMVIFIKTLNQVNTHNTKHHLHLQENDEQKEKKISNEP